MADIEDTGIPSPSHASPPPPPKSIKECKAAATAGGESADPHIAWWEEHAALHAALQGPRFKGVNFDDDGPEEWLRFLELEDLVAGTPARTLHGVLVQVRCIAQEHIGIAEGNMEAGFANVLATLERLTGEARS